MNFEAIQHIPMSQQAHGIDPNHVVFRLRAGRDDLKHCTLFYADRACRLTPVIFSSVEMQVEAQDEWFDYFQVILESPYKRICYYFELDDGTQKLLYYGDFFTDHRVDDRSEYYQLPFNHPADIAAPPAWAQDAVVYNIFPDSFATGRRFISGKSSEKEWNGQITRGKLGGTLRGVIENLDYIQELGATCIYMNPIFAAGEYHKYDLLDYHHIDPCFGTDEDFRQLVNDCHARGMRVIIDGVFNHVGWNFFAFDDVVRNGENSKYKNWFYHLQFPVSKVLHKSYSISQETCDRVNAVIKELGYQPNRRAQSFATGATKTILFLAEMQHGVGFDNPHLFEIMAGVENALSEKGYGLIVQHSTALDLWQHFDELLQGSYVDGVILHASVVSKDVALCLAHTELPYIVVGAPDFSNQLCWIDTNNSVAGQIAVTHLWRNGYDRIAFIGGPKEDTISAHRLSGALATLNEKIPAGYLREGPPTSEGGAAAARALLELQTRPNAVICANQYIAFGCVNELKASGVRIPEDMAVITFDDFPFSKIIEPQLSVVNLDMYDMGEQAAKVVLRRIRTPQYLVQSQTTLPILIERQSTKKLP